MTTAQPDLPGHGTSESPAAPFAPTMRAVVATRYGGAEVLQIQDRALPSPGAGEVLVRVRATSVNAADWHLMRGSPVFVRAQYGLRRPKNPVLGSDVAGIVESAGEGVTRFKPGDAVYGDTSAAHHGAFAEYVCAPERAFVATPGGITFEQAAAVPMAGLTALQSLRDGGGLKAGQNVLVYGASGGVGTFAVQIARALGATVTAACSTTKMEQAAELGADRVLDYTKEDPLRAGDRYDVVLATNGSRSAFDLRRALRPGGTAVIVGGALGPLAQAALFGPVFRLLRRGSVRPFLARTRQEDLEHLSGLLTSGTIAPVIERTYPFEELAEAMRYVDAGHARGKIVVTVASE